MRLLPALSTSLLCTLAVPGMLAAQELDDEALGQQQTPIVNGSLPEDIPEHRAVVALHALIPDGNRTGVSAPFCTGTLISDTVVLTAAHCLVESPVTGAPFRPQDLVIYVGNDPRQDFQENFFFVEDLEVFPTYDPNTLFDDIAVVVIEEPASVTPIPPLPPIIGLADIDAGERLNFAGFGQDENEASGVKLQTDGAIGGLGCTVEGCPSGYTGDPETQVSYAMTDTGPCFGDSGGPAFLYRGGRPYVAGVTSFGDENCTLYGVSTRVDAYMDWLEGYIGRDPAAPSVTLQGLSDGDVVPPGAEIQVAATDDRGVVRMDLYVDGAITQTLMAEPWVFQLAGDLPDGEHQIIVAAYDSANSVFVPTKLLVDESAAGGCSATGTNGNRGTVALLALALLLALRRPRRAWMRE